MKILSPTPMPKAPPEQPSPIITHTIGTLNKDISNNVNQKQNPNMYSWKNIDKFDFNVVRVNEKPKNISELNGNKGFAFWIDKSVLKNIRREIYEFLFFTRKDIKLAETEDGNISVINCRDIGDKKWKIHTEFYL